MLISDHGSAATQEDPCSTQALDVDLGWTLGIVFRAYARAAGEIAAHVPGGPRGFLVLAAAVQEVPGSQGAMAIRLGIDKTVMTYLIDDLEAAGLVARVADTSDRRHKRITATETGRQTWAEVRCNLALAEQHVLAPLNAPDQQVFRGLLQQLALGAELRDRIGTPCPVLAGQDAEPAQTKPGRAHRR